MSKREEINKILLSLTHCVENDKAIVLDSYSDKILALTDCNCERVREYCEKWGNQSTSNTIKLICTEILSILSENEKPFDVREWLKEKVGERTDNADWVIKRFRIYISHKDNYMRISEGEIGNKNSRYSGSIPTSRYFFETLLKALGIAL